MARKSGTTPETLQVATFFWSRLTSHVLSGHWSFHGDHLLQNELTPAALQCFQFQAPIGSAEALRKAVSQMVHATDLVASGEKPTKNHHINVFIIHIHTYMYLHVIIHIHW
jgi:glucose-6-phosphate isomerase